ncbi:UNVERIFIED_CONTAM: hypothetical protein PYX00_000451 [Menopon gallinae]|uniref:Uncharacterized protein n=1 Tax=Menopon gallinae TaxID=328185 RepID=A0AAW2IA12_9NEOP
MIKWLSASRLKNANQCEPTPLTNDPLAAIAGVNDPDGKCQIYAVTRVNPLFKEERSPERKVEGPAVDDNSDENADQRLSPRKSISSGYESRCNSSSESSSCTECESKAVKKPASSQKREKRWTRQAKKRNSDHDSSDVTALKSPGSAPLKRRSRKYKNGSPPGSSNLSPIPEGKIDCSIPPPIWPRFGTEASETARDTQVPGAMPFHDGTTNPLNFMYKYNEKYPKCCNGSSRSLWNYFDEKGQLSGAISVKTEYEHNWIECCRNQCNDSYLAKSADDGEKGTGTLERPSRNAQLTRDLLRDLANLVSYAMKRKNVLSVEEILMTLSESIQKSLDLLSKADAAEELRDEKRDDIYSSGSEGKTSNEYSSGTEKDAYGPVRGFEEKKDKPGEGAGLIYHQRECSSSSTESGFCFSDSSPTPSSDSSSNEQGRGVPNPLFLYDSVYGVPKSVRDAIVCDSRDRTSDAFKDAAARDCGSSAFVKLISAKRKVSGTDETGPLTEQEGDNSVKVDNNILKKVEHPYYVSVAFPSFRLLRRGGDPPAGGAPPAEWYVSARPRLCFHLQVSKSQGRLDIIE